MDDLIARSRIMDLKIMAVQMQTAALFSPIFSSQQLKGSLMRLIPANVKHNNQAAQFCKITKLILQVAVPAK